MTDPTAVPDMPSTARAKYAMEGRLWRLPAVVAAALLLASCSSDVQRVSLPAGNPDACRPGTFIGSMTGNCPQPVR